MAAWQVSSSDLGTVLAFGNTKTGFRFHSSNASALEVHGVWVRLATQLLASVKHACALWTIESWWSAAGLNRQRIRTWESQIRHPIRICNVFQEALPLPRPLLQLSPSTSLPISLKGPDPKWRLPFPQQMQTDLLSPSRALQFFFLLEIPATTVSCGTAFAPWRKDLEGGVLETRTDCSRGEWRSRCCDVQRSCCRALKQYRATLISQPGYASVCVRTRTLLNWQHSCGNSCLPLLSWTSESQEQNWLIILHFGRMEFTDSGSQLICITQWCFYILLWTKKVNSWVIKIRSLYNPNCLELQWFGWGDPWKTLTFCILVNKCTVLTPVKWVSKDIVWLDKLNLILWGSDIL